MKKRILIFWQDNCPKCPSLKRVGNDLKKDGIEVVEFDIGTAEGLAEASFYGLLSVPSMIIEEDEKNTLATFHGIVPDHKEIMRHLNG